MTISQQQGIDNIKQMLIETIADFLDKPEIMMIIDTCNLNDADEREDSELHIRMALASMNEFVKTSVK